MVGVKYPIVVCAIQSVENDEATVRREFDNMERAATIAENAGINVAHVVPDLPNIYKYDEGQGDPPIYMIVIQFVKGNIISITTFSK